MRMAAACRNVVVQEEEETVVQREPGIQTVSLHCKFEVEMMKINRFLASVIPFISEFIVLIY